MAHSIKDSQLQEIKAILWDGRYYHNRSMRILVDYLGLAFAKYILFAGIESWRRGAKKPFDECPLGRGQRTQAIHYLIEKKVLVYDNNRRTRAKNFTEKINRLEKEIKEKKKKDDS